MNLTVPTGESVSRWTGTRSRVGRSRLIASGRGTSRGVRGAATAGRPTMSRVSVKSDTKRLKYGHSPAVVWRPRLPPHQR